MEKSEILKQMFDKDYVEKEIDFAGKDLPRVVIRTIDYESQLNLEDYIKELADTEGIAKRKFLQQYAHALLSYTLVQWGSMKDATPEDWRVFLSNKSVALLDKLVKEQNILETSVRKALNLQDVEETFFPKAEHPGGSNSSQTESTLEGADQSGKQSSLEQLPKKKKETSKHS